MSTRCTTGFVDGNGSFAPVAGQGLDAYAVEARVYRHSDGYPDGHGSDLGDFLSAVEAQCRDRRFSDASYLAAKLVVYLAAGFADDSSRPLDFLSLGICSQDPAQDLGASDV